MKNLIFVLLIALIFQTSTQATNPDTLDYTVVAPSGLSLRTAPYLDAERLEIIPYGTSVKTIGVWDEVYSLERMDTVDTRAGYWIETDYNGKSGYLFSGYLKTGPLYVPATEINQLYRISVPGERCQAVNYDPALHWYGIYVDPEAEDTKVKAVDISIEQTTLTEMDEEMAYADIGDFLQVKSEQQDSFLMYFGAINEIDTENIDYEKSYFENIEMDHWDPQGKFIYPYEKIKIAEEGYDQYFLVGHENVTVNENPQPFEDKLTKRYDIFLTDNQGGINMSNGDTVSLGAGMNLEHLSDYQYATYLGPRLVWQGDINKDGFPDVIFYSPYMSECCGGSISYHLFVSKQVDGIWKLEKAAEDEIFSCFGC